MTRREAIKFVLVRSLGNFLLLFALYGVVATFGPAVSYEAQYRIIQLRGVHFTVSSITHAVEPQNVSSDEKKESISDSSQPGFAQVIAGNKEQVLIPKDTDFSISIPKIGASAKIYPNVDPSNPAEFLPILQKGIAHAKGSVFPGLPGTVYLFAHSTDNWWDVGRYNAVFYLLWHLDLNDQIVVFFEGRRYEYVVSQKIISDLEDTSLLTNAQSGSQQRLVLQTCWPPGTTLKRLYIIAIPKS